MGIFWRRHLGYGPLGLNLSKSGLGLSLRLWRGLHLGMSSSRGPYVSASLPGTGLMARYFLDNRHFDDNPRTPIRIPHHAVAGGNPLSVPHPVGPTAHELHPFSYACGYLFGLVLMALPIVMIAWFVVRLLTLR